MITINKNGERVAFSKNLRGISDYARKHGVDKVLVSEQQGDETYTEVIFYFSNDAWSIVIFADWTVAVEWVARRVHRHRWNCASSFRMFPEHQAWTDRYTEKLITR